MYTVPTGTSPTTVVSGKKFDILEKYKFERKPTKECD